MSQFLENCAEKKRISYRLETLLHTTHLHFLVSFTPKMSPSSTTFSLHIVAFTHPHIIIITPNLTHPHSLTHSHLTKVKLSGNEDDDDNKHYFSYGKWWCAPFKRFFYHVSSSSSRAQRVFFVFTFPFPHVEKASLDGGEENVILFLYVVLRRPSITLT